MSFKNSNEEIKKIPSLINGLDLITEGGLPKGRTTLISGTAGSAKTVLACQFLSLGIKLANESGVFVTFEESPEDIRQNMLGFGWDIKKWEKEEKWAFVDAAHLSEDKATISGDYDFGALLARIEHAKNKVGAKRLSMDSLGAIFTQFTESAIVRNEMFRISSALKKMGVTALLTAERLEEYGDIARYGVEEFVADNVIILRNVLDDEKRRRTIEILKFRGTSHQKGEFPFTIISGEGVVVIPLSAMELKQKSSNIRISSGNKILDNMCGGGYFRDSIILASGATGTGKTLMVTEFIGKGAKNDEKCLLFAFEESREQLFRNAERWGVNFKDLEKSGRLKVVCDYPEVRGLEEHLVHMKSIINEFKPNRIAVDSLSALERVSNIKGFREFVIGLTSFIKHQEVAGLFTSATPTLMGGSSVTEGHISTITDSIILLRYVEMFGEIQRGITVLKMRGSKHEKDIRSFHIDGTGMHIDKPFNYVTGILSGNTTHISESELSRLENLFLDKK